MMNPSSLSTANCLYFETFVVWQKGFVWMQLAFGTQCGHCRICLWDLQVVTCEKVCIPCSPECSSLSAPFWLLIAFLIEQQDLYIIIILLSYIMRGRDHILISDNLPNSVSALLVLWFCLSTFSSQGSPNLFLLISRIYHSDWFSFY